MKRFASQVYVLALFVYTPLFLSTSLYAHDAPASFPNTWYSNTTYGNWSDPASWNSAIDGSGTTGMPTSIDLIVIQAGDTVDTDAGFRTVSSMNIEGVLKLSDTFAGHDFGALTGAGTLMVESVLPQYDGLSSTFFNTGTVAYCSSNSYTLPSSPSQYYSLILQGSGTRTASSDITVTQDVHIKAGTLAMGTHDLTVLGNWYNQVGTQALQSTGKVTFGSSSQTQTISGVTTFNDLVVSKTTQTLTISDSLWIVGDFTINSGTVNSGTSTLLVGNDWTNHGTYLSTGTVVFNGANTTHAIGGTSTTAFNHLIIDGTDNIFEYNSQMTIQSDLTVSSGTFRKDGILPLSLQVPGNLTVNAAGSLDASLLSTITVGSHWNNQGTFIPGVNEVVYSSSDAQLLSGETAFYGLRKTGGGTLSLTDSCTVLGTLTLTDGHVHTTDTSMLLLGVNANVVGGSVDSYVEGPLTHAVDVSALLGDTRLFPFGSADKYRPVSLNVNLTGLANTAYYRGELHEGPPPERTLPVGIHHTSSVRYYTINQSALVATGFSVSASVNIAYNDDDIVDTPSELRMLKSDGTGNWLNIGGTGSGMVGDITSNTFTSFSDFVVGSSTENNPLPVEMVSLTARQKGQQVGIEWATASETNNSHFVVERARDGKNYRPVATVAGSGDSQQEKTYQAWDHAPRVGYAYYRLMQVDHDGQYTYTRPVSVEFQWLDRVNVQLQPNPASTEAVVAIHGLKPGGSVHIQLINPVGQVVAQYQYESTMPSLEVPITGISHCAPGIYTVTVRSDSFRWAERLIVE